MTQNTFTNSFIMESNPLYALAGFSLQQFAPPIGGLPIRKTG